jgi:hypothetical protein
MSATILQTGDLKKRAGKILDAARRVPQFVIRAGQLFKITRIELPVAAQNPPPGYFDDCYPLPASRRKLEEKFSRIQIVKDFKGKK